MVEREFCQWLDVVGFQRQQLDVVRDQLRRKQFSKRASQRQLSQTIFEGDLQQTDRRQPTLIGKVFNGHLGTRA